MLHAFGAAVAHGIEKRLAVAFTFFNVLPGAHRGLENFHGGDAPLSVLLRKEALGNDAAKSFREARADALLVGHGENTNDALHGFRSINGMQRGHDQVTRFRSFQGDLNRFPVTHFADENDFRRLPERRAQCQRKGRSV